MHNRTSPPDAEVYHLHHNDFTVYLDGGRSRVVSHASRVIDWEVTCAETGLAAETGARISRIRRYVKSPYFLTKGERTGRAVPRCSG
ncbi:MAG TPA: hypothetical protein VJP78_11270, partial [Thermoleophilia bacterium]|nr:hypothetical protein [Thermoleophilia bacterium]